MSSDAQSTEQPVGLRDHQSRDLVLTAHAVPGEKLVKLARVEMVQPSGGTWSLVCDEGPYLGGDGSAPPPLTYLAASIGFCLLTQIGRYAKIMRLQLDAVAVDITTRFHLEGSVREGTLRGSPLDFDFAFKIDSPEAEEQIARLLRSAENSCYVTQSLLQPVRINRSSELNGRPFPQAFEG